MIAGWEDQQRARFPRHATIEQRVSVIRRFAAFADLFPWQWTPAEAEAGLRVSNSATSPDSRMRSHSLRTKRSLPLRT